MRFIPTDLKAAGRLAVCMFAAFAFNVSALAEIYSWTDRNGVKHFSSDPPPKGELVSDLRVMKTVEEPEEPEAGDAEKTVADTTAREAPKNAPKVDIYVDSQSDICQTALAFFDRNKIAYTKHEIDNDPEARQRYKSLEGQGIPIIFIGDERMDGWDEESVKIHLGLK
jgi:glutaredoxin